MPEGHVVHRLAAQFNHNFKAQTLRVTSPQGRFAAGAKRLDGLQLLQAKAVGKQMFIEFSDDNWLRVHLGIYGMWNFAGEIKLAPQMQMHSRHDRQSADSAHFPPPPRGQVRARLLGTAVCADLRGPTVCEVLDPVGVQQVLRRLGPDPANDNSPQSKAEFIARAGQKRTPIGLVLMDQSVVAGIGNIYRAEMLYRAKLNPHTPAQSLSAQQLGKLWDDWAELLQVGISTGQMLTIDGLQGDEYARALSDPATRHAVYKHAQEACGACGATILLEEFGARKLYWCPGCQH